MQYFIAVAASLFTVVVFGAGTASAAIEVYLPVAGTPTTVGGRVAGSVFETTAPITFNSLGFLDLNDISPTLLGPDGIHGSYEVGLWDFNTQALLASTTVTPASPLGENPGSQFRYAPIPATLIVANQTFVIGALLPAGPTPDAWLSGGFNVNSVNFTLPGSGQFLVGSTLSFPTSLDGAVYAVANASTQVVPEPSACLYLGTVGAGMLWRRRRRANEARCT